jgi:nitrogen PTS system EIIA component
MQLGVKDVAELFNVNEKTIYRWLQNGSMPAYRVNNHYRFNRAELLEWAMSQRINVSAELFEEPKDFVQAPSLVDAIKAGGIHYRIEGNDKKTALQKVVELIRLPDEVDRELLLQVLLAREALASTAIGEGIAIPHVRNPIVMHIQQPIVSLCFLEQPIDFDALDGKPVNCLFTLISPSVKAHLFLLSRLAFALRDSDFKNIIIHQGSREEILNAASKVESTFEHDNTNQTVNEIT